jgi:hypothetical protein
MTEYTTYVAFDGSEFDDEDDCLAYERTMKATDYEKEIFFYGINREPVPLNVEDLDDVYFVNIKTEKAKEWFVDRCYDSGSVHPWSYDPYRREEFPMTGFFWFDTYDDTWHHWQTEIERLNAIRDYFQLFEED